MITQTINVKLQPSREKCNFTNGRDTCEVRHFIQSGKNRWWFFRSECDPTKTVFSIMVSSLFRKWSTIVRLVPFGSSSVRELFPTIQSVISDVEQCNLSVQVISTDPYHLNVNLFKLFSSDHTLQPIVQHPVDSTGNLFLIFDFVHVLKSIRITGLMSRTMAKYLSILALMISTM